MKIIIPFAKRASYYLPTTFACTLLVLTYAPWRFALPREGIEGSWAAAITYGARAGWQWGRDIVYTYGPLGFALTTLWDDALFVPELLIKSLLIAALAIGTAEVLRDKATPVSALLAVIIVLPLVLMTHFSVYSALPLLAAANHFKRADEPLSPDAALLACTVGVLALIFPRTAVSGLGIFLLIESSRVRHRRVPAMVALFAGAFVVAWLSAGQDLAALPTYLRSCYEQIAGYAGALSLAGPLLELGGFLITSAAGLLLIAKAERHRFGDPAQRLDASLFTGALAVYWFIEFKRGFIRHDLHSIGAWFSLATAAAIYVAARHKDISSRSVWYALVGLSLVATTTAILLRDGKVRRSGMSAVPLVLERALESWESLKQLAEVTRDPRLWASE